MAEIEKKKAEKQSRIGKKIITLPTTGVSHKDRWVVGSTTYEITAVRARTAEWVRVFEAVVLE